MSNFSSYLRKLLFDQSGESIACCEEIGGHMLTIDSVEENNQMYTYLARYGISSCIRNLVRFAYFLAPLRG